MVLWSARRRKGNERKPPKEVKKTASPTVRHTASAISPPCTRFHPETVDTFCFQRPGIKSYVLVRVLETTLALHPINTQSLAHYFEAPVSTAPSHRFLPFASTESPDQFWPTELSDVLPEPNALWAGWIQAVCTIETQGECDIILHTRHTQLRLTARDARERRLFVHLVRFKQASVALPVEKPSNAITPQRLWAISSQAVEIRERCKPLLTKIDQAQRDIAEYFRLLSSLDRALLDLSRKVRECTQNGIPFQNTLQDVNEELDRALFDYRHMMSRMSILDDWDTNVVDDMQLHLSSLTIANPWFYRSMVLLVLTISALVMILVFA